MNEIVQKPTVLQPVEHDKFGLGTTFVDGVGDRGTAFPAIPDKDESAPETQVYRSIETFIPKGEAFEIRVLGTGYKGLMTHVGYFDDPEAAVEQVMTYVESGDYKGIYFTRNRINPDLLARSVNRIVETKDATKDEHVQRLTWLLVDLDPRRPTRISSTDAELEAARDLAGTIRQYLEDSGCHGIVGAESGNGVHLHIPIDLPNDSESVALLRNVLASLSARFSNEQVEVDTTTFNPSRICKLYGTMALKGDSTVTRPHRMATIQPMEKQA